MRPLAAVAIIAGLLAFQTAVLPEIQVLGVRPDLVLVVLMLWAFVRGPQEGRTVVLATAVVYGMLTSDPAGFSLLALSPIVPLAFLRETQIGPNPFVTALAAVALATLVYQTLYTILLTATYGGTDLLGTLTYVYLPAVVVNVALAPVVYLLVLRLSGDVADAR